MASLTLIVPPLIVSKTAYSAVVSPPLGPAYIAAALESAGHSVTVIDAQGEAPWRRVTAAHPRLAAYGLSLQEIVQRIPNDTAAVGVSCMFSQQWPHVEALCNLIRSVLPNVPILVGGEHVTATAEHLLRTCEALTVCVLGEGEETAVDLALWIDGARSLESILGIAFRSENGIVRTQRRARTRGLENIAWPAWHLFPIHKYLDGGYGFGVQRGRSLPMLATRGCPYQCTFCSSPDMWTTRYYLRPVNELVDEIETYVARYRVSNIDFQDLTAFVKKDWIIALCREIERRGLAITYQVPGGTRSEVLDKEVLDWLRRTGCKNICYAPESGDEQTLVRIKKRINLERMTRSIVNAIDLKMVVKVHTIIGFPGETRREMWNTLWFGLKCAWMGVDDISVFPFTPYPGSALHQQLVREERIGPMDADYFASLDVASVRGRQSYCEASNVELALYQLAGVVSCVAVGFIRRPSRIIRLVGNVLRKRSETSFERGVFDLVRRFRPKHLTPH